MSAGVLVMGAFALIAASCASIEMVFVELLEPDALEADGDSEF